LPKADAEVTSQLRDIAALTRPGYINKRLGYVCLVTLEPSSCAFKPLLKQAELPDVTFHSLRHTANSLLIEAGEDPLAIVGSFGALGHPNDVRAIRSPVQPYGQARRPNRGPDLLSRSHPIAVRLS
jgi:integrase